ncbi:hypothetical protein FB451DRAFT_1167485 [Mycena latifolia]|nr:hypothetical protein FB451DRAFT_1167485 [Mycena latifolia]
MSVDSAPWIFSRLPKGHNSALELQVPLGVRSHDQHAFELFEQCVRSPLFSLRDPDSGADVPYARAELAGAPAGTPRECARQSPGASWAPSWSIGAREEVPEPVSPGYQLGHRETPAPPKCRSHSARRGRAPDARVARVQLASGSGMPNAAEAPPHRGPQRASDYFYLPPLLSYYHLYSVDLSNGPSPRRTYQLSTD